jgi:hypothetical protein
MTTVCPTRTEVLTFQRRPDDEMSLLLLLAVDEDDAAPGANVLNQN